MNGLQLAILLTLAFLGGFGCCMIFVYDRHLRRDHDETPEGQVERIIKELEERPEAVLARAQAELERRIRKGEI